MQPPRPNYPAKLSQREMDCLLEIARNTSNKAIAAKLNVSLKTVQVHIDRAYKKINAHTRIEALKWMFRNRVITYEEFIADSNITTSPAPAGTQTGTPPSHLP